jgi:lactate dehydrogenase-like 2-hydroxyacid dehydrogenase
MTQVALLNNGKLPPALVDRLRGDYAWHDLTAEADPRAFLAARGGEFTALVTSAGRGADAALIEAMPKLRVISSFGVGLDKLALDAAGRRDIAVGYTPDVLNECVADTAIALMLDAMRAFSASDRFVRRGDWAAGKGWPLARKVSGAKLGIVGFGRIGQAIAQRAVGFGMPIRYHTRRPVEDVSFAHETSLLELARWCDVMVVIVAGGAGTRHLIDAAVLDALGPRGFIVNVARGTVIDETALVSALQDKRIAGAGLDVFYDEPPNTVHTASPEEYRHMENVVLTPHNGGATWDSRTRQFTNMAIALIDHIKANQPAMAAV